MSARTLKLISVQDGSLKRLKYGKIAKLQKFAKLQRKNKCSSSIFSLFKAQQVLKKKFQHFFFTEEFYAKEFAALPVNHKKLRGGPQLKIEMPIIGGQCNKTLFNGNINLVL